MTAERNLKIGVRRVTLCFCPFVCSRSPANSTSSSSFVTPIESSPESVWRSRAPEIGGRLSLRSLFLSALEAATELAHAAQTVVSVSGAVDLVADGRVLGVSNGLAPMQKITAQSSLRFGKSESWSGVHCHSPSTVRNL
ncbi:hypothetical protein R1sor_022155 [Riccia sorocarpa]|uniref:Uncharacterized protein n=1 Tax=Riccia sorocarpa TaxID=122646 RepID=A0ABD3GL85_9MARC